MLEALSKTREAVKVCFAGVADNSDYELELKKISQVMGVGNKIKWLGFITEKDKIDLYANSRAVIYPPVDEDYGYVTLEAMLSSKPVITCSDSGGTLEFVKHRENGLIAEPTAESLAQAIDEIWQNRTQALDFGRAGKNITMNIISPGKML